MAHDEADFGIDFDGAAATRGEILHALRGRLDDDVLRALQHPGTPDWLLSQPFHVVQHLEELHGPADAAVGELDPRWGMPGAGRGGELVNWVGPYRQVLMYGTAEEQGSALHAGQLVALWSEIRPGIPTAIVQVWEQRFPELNAIRR
ncbi:hypothetical protein PUR49_11155 [Streptomyces sp. BE147]|nr:hypothetical protein [Streptomyces sp. BE147]